MFGLKKIRVGESEKAILFRERRFQTVLRPGVYRWFDPFRKLHAEICDISEPLFEHRIKRFLAADHQAETAEHFYVFETNDRQVGLCYFADSLADIIPPGTLRFYWRGPVEIRMELLDISENFEVAQDKLGIVLQRQKLRTGESIDSFILAFDVEENHKALLSVDGKHCRTLGPGRYGFWRFNRTLKVFRVDTRIQNVDVAGQEILTKDKVTLRINLSAGFRVMDPELMQNSLSSYSDHLYKELQFGLREAVGTKTLDELLENKESLAEAVLERARRTINPYGITVEQVGVKDVILPGEMRTILNQVVEAEKAAQANLIRRREETAATRSLHNTAKMMEDNPVLLRLKELEMLERVTEKIDKFTVFGGVDGILKDLVRIKSV